MKINVPVSTARLFAVLLLISLSAHAQDKSNTKSAATNQPATTTTTNAQTSATPAATKATVLSAATTPLELARATFISQGGEKYRALKNIVLFGSADLYAPDSAQTLSGKFGMISSGDRVRLEVQSPLFNFTLISDGARTYTSMRGFELPPAGAFGIPVLLKFDQPGYVVSALPEKKKERAFRITEPEGMMTNFYVDAATGRLLRFEVPYGGYTYGFEFKNMKEIDGVLIPLNFTQRILTPQGSFFAEFKVKDAKLNQDLPADTFNIPNK